MQKDAEIIQGYFAKLGLEPEIADIYLALYAHGPQTMSELARSSGVERTRIYRLIDQLMDSSLIELESQSKRGILKAAPVANIRILISKREQELHNLQDELTMIEQLFGRNQLASPATRVQTYQGDAGIKQMLWNETRAQGEICGILYENIQLRAGRAFFERWTDACNRHGITFRGIVSPAFTASQELWYNGEVREQLDSWEYRMAPSNFPINHSTIVYNDVVGYFNWKDDEVYGIEVYNRDIAASQRSYFDLLWNVSQHPAKNN